MKNLFSTDFSTGFGHPGLVGGVPAPGRGLELDEV